MLFPKVKWVVLPTVMLGFGQAVAHTVIAPLAGITSTRTPRARGPLT
jgi:hypothetical protein